LASAAQYHFEFPSEQDARRFVHSVAWSFEDVALYRQESRVIVVDAEGRARQERLLTMAILKDGKTT
jgi:hypothetical protein